MRFVSSSGLYLPRGARDLGRIEIGARKAGFLDMPSWAPTSPDEANAWMEQQLDVWDRPDVRRTLASTKDNLVTDLGLDVPPAVLPPGVTMNEAQMTLWMTEEIRANGFPQSPEAAAEMTLRFLDAQGQALGFHPGVVGALDLVTHWPSDAESAADWSYRLAANVGQQYGVPIPASWDAKGVIVAASSTACLQAGVPYVGIAIVTVEGLWDGKLQVEEIRSIAVATGAAISAAVGQYFGIPAPIGAAVGAFITDITFGVLADIFDWGATDAEKRGQAWMQAQATRAAMIQQCTELGHEAWFQYNQYWNAITADLSRTLYDQRALLGEGLRYFGTTYLTAIEEPCNPLRDRLARQWKIKSACPVVHPLYRVIDRHCAAPTGCLYYGNYGEQAVGLERRPAATGNYDQGHGEGHIDLVPRPQDILPVPTFTGARNPAYALDAEYPPPDLYDPYSALAFYGATRYATPYQPLIEYYVGAKESVLWPRTTIRDCWASRFQRARCWEDELHSDREYLAALAFVQAAPSAAELDQCVVPVWAEFMMASLVQVGPALTLVQGDATRTIAAVASEAELRSTILTAAAAAGVARTEEAQLRLWHRVLSGQERLMSYELTRSVTVDVARKRQTSLRSRREKASAEARLNLGLLALGSGALAGWLGSRIMR